MKGRGLEGLGVEWAQTGSEAAFSRGVGICLGPSGRTQHQAPRSSKLPPV